MSGTWAQIADAIAAEGRAMLVSVVATRGSVPREAGARMVIRPSGGFYGTIGGGQLEWQALARARNLFVSQSGDGLWTRDYVLGPELGQCCGGRVSVAFEAFGAERRDEVVRFARLEEGGGFATRATLRGDGPPQREIADPDELGEAGCVLAGGALLERFGAARTPLLLFGAGHVGRALVLALAPLPFAITWIDPRPDAFPAQVPANVACLRADDPAALLADAPARAFVLVMTHSHALDQSVVHRALDERRFDFVGLIGSDTKRSKFLSRMRAAGLSEGALQRLVCPIGIDGIRSKDPASVAASVAAQLLVRRETCRKALGTGPAERQLAETG